jgi:hypothetical protein
MSFISIEDITQTLFSRIEDDEIKQVYVDLANAEAVSFAQTKKIFDPELIKTDPLDSTFKLYLISFALYNFANDYIGLNDTEVSEGDTYGKLFERSLFLINRYKPEITYEMLTGTVAEVADRAVSFGRLVRR